MYISLIIAVSLLSTSCSTMFNSGTQSMQVVTSDGLKHSADIRTPDGAYSAEIPATITASPSTFNGVEVTIKASDCYNPTSIKVGKTITPSFWANVFNIYGFIIDPLTGAMWQYNQISTLPISKKENCKN